MSSQPTLRLLVLFFVLTGTAGHAGLNEWTSNGPFGGFMRDVAMDPSDPDTLYAVTGHGRIFKTTDAGGRWFPISRLAASHVVVDPSDSAVLYAATGEGPFKSTDGGRTWTEAREGIGGGTTIAIAIDPLDPDTLYAGTLSVGTMGERLGDAFKSTDAGSTWVSVGLGGPVEAFAIDPSNPDVVYAGAIDGGVFKSVDGGGSWTQRLTGVRVQALAVAASAPAVVFAGTVDDGVFKSTDGGATWEAAGLAGTTIRSLAVGPMSPETLYAGTQSSGVFRSFDGAASWSAANEGLSDPYVAALVIHPSNPDVVYAATVVGAGILRSTDAAATWTARNVGLNGVQIEALALDPFAPNTLYAGAELQGVFKSSDAGATWATANEGLPDAISVRALAVDPANPDVVYAGTSVGEGSGTVFRSLDAGATWVASGEGLRGAPVRALAIDPSSPDTVYAATRAGVFKSTNAGAHWGAASDGLTQLDVRALAIDSSDPDVLYAGNLDGVFRSSDAGRSWSPTSLVTPSGVWAVAIDPSNSEVLYALTSGEIYRSADGGATWLRLVAVPEPALSLAIDPTITARLYIAGGGLDRTVWRSRDGGRSWPDPLGSLEAQATALVVDPRNPSRLYAGTFDASVFEITLPPDPATLFEAQSGRFTVEVEWRDFRDAAGLGTIASVPDGAAPVALRSQDSAVVEFFGPNNWELMLKILDGRALNGRFWVFFAAATNVGFTVQVTDTSCGDEKSYSNALGVAAPAVTDVTAFPGCAEPLAPSCEEGPGVLCLGESGRFRVAIGWTDFSGNTGFGRQVYLADAGQARSRDSGVFYFFSQDNWELLVKVLDGCGINHHFWVFTAATTNVRYRLRVTDRQSGEVRTYENPLGEAADALNDTTAFATCDGS